MSLSLVLDPAVLAELLAELQTEGVTPDQARLRIVDLRSEQAYTAGHIPGAVHGNAALLNRSAPPVGGLLPESDVFNRFLRDIGTRTGDKIVAYDAGGETAAARLIWVLNAYGYEAGSWLNGGFGAWQAAHLPESTEAYTVSPGDLSLSLIGDNTISAEHLMGLLDDTSVSILDVRSAGEYAGTDVRSAMGGRVPGARHIEWTAQLGTNNQLLDDATLMAQLETAGIRKDNTVVVYCQTHQRSSVTYVALKNLGYTDIRALDGAWSNWGNRADTPKQTDA